MNVYCKMSSKAPVIISANVDWIPTGNMENMGVKRGKYLPAKSKYVMGKRPNKVPGSKHTDKWNAVSVLRWRNT